MALSRDALLGSTGPKTMKLQGQLQGKEALILIDSASSHTFLNSRLAAELSGFSVLSQPIKVTVANGESLVSRLQLSSASWSVQGCEFSSSLKVIPLSSYDIVIGMDWLEDYSPMQVHWKQKWMLIPYHGSSVLLQGILPEVHEETVIQLCMVQEDVTTSDDFSKLPRDIQALLYQYKSIFDKPLELPPSRACDHTTPLIPGARPVNIRSYRYPQP